APSRCRRTPRPARSGSAGASRGSCAAPGRWPGPARRPGSRSGASWPWPARSTGSPRPRGPAGSRSPRDLPSPLGREGSGVRGRIAPALPPHPNPSPPRGEGLLKGPPHPNPSPPRGEGLLAQTPTPDPAMPDNTTTLDGELQDWALRVKELRDTTLLEVARVVVGMDRVTRRFLIALLAGGHVLLEG